MKFDKDQKAKIYAVYKRAYYGMVGCELVWSKGEKKRAIDVFALISYELQESENFSRVFDVGVDYILDSTERWLEWKHSSRANYFGFLLNRQSLTLYCKRKSQKPKIAGKEYSEGWDV